MRYQRFVSREMLLVMAACLVVGAGAGFVAASYLYAAKATVLASDLNRQATQRSRLENLLAQISQVAGGQSASLASPPLASAAPAPEAANTAPPLLPADVRRLAVAAMKAAAAKEVAATTASAAASRQPPVRASVPAAPGVSVAAVPVSSSEVKAAVEGSHVEGVAASKAGVQSLRANSVVMRSGAVVRVGEKFPSGERLLKVDPENGRVVTSERQMLLFFSPE